MKTLDMLKGICERHRIADHRRKSLAISDAQWRNFYRNDVEWLLGEIERLRNKLDTIRKRR